MRSDRLLIAVAVAAVALAVGGAAQAAQSAKTLRGVVGPGFTISVNVKSVKAGMVTLRVRDRSDEHNFRIKGPGVNRATSVNGTGTSTWKLRLRRATYTIVCDPHRSSMRTRLRVT
jgi:plastocyanin